MWNLLTSEKEKPPRLGGGFRKRKVRIMRLSHAEVRRSWWPEQQHAALVLQ